MHSAAGGTEVSVECLNKFERSDQTQTFYVGPMNGLLCLGMVDEEALPFDEVVSTADSRAAWQAASPAPESTPHLFESAIDTLPRWSGRPKGGGRTLRIARTAEVPAARSLSEYSQRSE